MSNVMNLYGSRGTSSPVVAFISVKYPIGTSCYASSNGVTLYGDATTEGYVFRIPFMGTWYVEGTYNGETEYQNVVVNSNQNYSIELEFSFRIFATGYGALVPLTTDAQSNASVTVDSTAITTTFRTTSYVVSLWYTTSQIDVTDYSSLKIEINMTSHRSTPIAFVSTQVPTISNAHQVKSTNITTDGQSTITVDLSNVTGGCYIGVKGSTNASVTNVWLEL